MSEWLGAVVEKVKRGVRSVVVGRMCCSAQIALCVKTGPPVRCTRRAPQLTPRELEAQQEVSHSAATGMEAVSLLISPSSMRI